MYNIFELKSKTLPELKEIATQLGIQVNSNTQAEDLVYTILDEQAITASKVSAQNSEGKKKKKKARTAKADNSKADDTPVQDIKEEEIVANDCTTASPAEDASNDNNDSEKAESAPRKNKPGRKKKQAPAESAKADAQQENEQHSLPTSHPALLESVDELFSSIHTESNAISQDNETEPAIAEQEPIQAPVPQKNGKSGKKQPAKKVTEAVTDIDEPLLPPMQELQEPQQFAQQDMEEYDEPVPAAQEEEKEVPASPGLSAFFPKATRFISRDKNGHVFTQQITPAAGNKENKRNNNNNNNNNANAGNNAKAADEPRNTPAEFRRDTHGLGRIGNDARRVRLPPFARLQLPHLARRHIRVAIANKALRA